LLTATAAKVALVGAVVAGGTAGTGVVANRYIAPCFLANRNHTPAQLLSTAVDKLNTESYRYSTSAAGITMEGQTAPKTRTLQATLSQGGNAVDIRLLSDDMYVAVPGSSGAPAWYHFSVKGLGADDPFAQASKPTSQAAFLNAVGSGEGSSRCTYRGTLDVNRLDPGSSPATGAAVPGFPFEAKLDHAGRLTAVTITVPAAANDGKQEVLSSKFWDYGTAVTVQRPANAQEGVPPTR
jgi:hypothetical protein